MELPDAQFHSLKKYRLQIQSHISGFDQVCLAEYLREEQGDHSRKHEVEQNDFDDDELRIIVSDHRLIRCDLSDKTCGTHAASRCIILHIGEDRGDGS